MNQPVVRKRKERGVILLWGTISMLLLIPMMGLAIDVGFLYSIKSKLQSAVDGAALAATRALTIGSTLSSQETNATTNATTWFNSNFPSGYFGTYNTTMGTPSYNSANEVMSIQITATTTVDSFFMKWLKFGATTISATGQASRRTVVAMLVLDRSGSMCAGGSQPCSKTATTLPCYQMINAAKIFTGQFQEGTDYIGMVSFSDNAYVHTNPVTNFQSVLGYSNASGSSTGDIDALACYGGTSTAEGMSIGYQLLYQTNLSGALNALVLETDGLPNTLVMNFWDSTHSLPGLDKSTSTCKDTSGVTYKNGGFGSSSKVPSWTTGVSMTSSPFLSSHSYYSNIPAGMIASVSSSDPGDSPEGFWAFLNYFQYSTISGTNPFNGYTFVNVNSGNSNIGCTQDGDDATPVDIGWFPASDVFGNSANPSAYTYENVSSDLDTYGHILQSGSNPSNWTYYHKAVLNATDNAAYIARSNATIPAYIFAIGLGGNSTNGPPDPILLQRMANDPNGDEFNTTGPDNGGYYWPCSNASEVDSYGAACTNWSSQPQGTFIYAPNSTYLTEAFLRISSQVLRLSK